MNVIFEKIAKKGNSAETAQVSIFDVIAAASNGKLDTVNDIITVDNVALKYSSAKVESEVPATETIEEE